MSEAQLRAVLGEIEARAISSQREMSQVKTQLQVSSRRLRLLDLTHTELSSLPDSTRVYEGIGKMFIVSERDEVTRRIELEKEGTEGDRRALEKKLTYLDTTFENAKAHIQAAMSPRPSQTS